MAEYCSIYTPGRSLQTSVRFPLILSLSSCRSGSFSLLAFLFIAAASLALQGCAGGSASSLTPSGTKTALTPSSASIQVWQSQQFSATGASGDTASCVWASSDSSILTSLGSGQFQGAQTGSARVTVTCGSSTASASVVVSAQQQSGPITITSGGTYSGNWVSDDASTPAVTIKTSDPVVLHDSVISSRGDLIQIANGSANVTIENVTGTALDPKKYGSARGSFISSGNVSSLIVKNCSMTGVSMGIKLVSATPSTLQIFDNEAIDLEDRASDGNGGLLATRAVNGHFLLLNHVSATSGAEIAWNKVTQTIGSSSIEDVFNVYSSQGSAAHPIWLHDNYMEGASSPSNSTDYTGVGIITDGTTANGNPATAYVLFEDNQIVKTAGGGIAIAAGHDIEAKNNHVVTCGVSADGTWYNHNGVAAYIWNIYSSESFYNNSITATAGGMVNPGASNSPIAHDLWVNPTDAKRAGVSSAGNNFTDPCLTSGGIDLQAEEEERTLWAQKIDSNTQLIGDQHLN